MFAVRTDSLTKDYRLGFWRRQSRRALDRLDLRVRQSEVFGLLGPNGAGKSTTLKILLGLVGATSGSAEILGRRLGDARLHERIGYLPENPYFYDYLTAEEFLSYAAELFGLRGAERRRRVGGLLERVGLADSRRVALGKFSKGMVQRLGIAQALVNGPELLILDEPMSGLDPLGRREVRDLILELKAQGKTVLFSTHILSDAEMLCDRVAILNRGRLEGSGDLADLLGCGAESTEIVLERPAPELIERLARRFAGVARTGDRVRLTLPAGTALGVALGELLREQARIISVNPVKVSLEEYFLARVGGAPSGDPGGAPPALDLESVGASDAGESQAAPRPGPALMPGPAAGAPSRASNLRERSTGATRRVAAVALHTFKEAVRDKVLYSLIVFALLLTGAAILFGSISVGVQRIFLVNLSLSAISVIGLVMAIFIGIGLVSKEIERRSVANVLSKPVRRAEFILGKYAGLLLTLGVNTAVMTAGFYVALFAEQRRFEPEDFAALEAVYFILLELALVVGIALVFSCLSTPALAAVYTFAVYVIGNFTGDLRGFGRESGSLLVERGTAALYYLLPNFGDFNVIARTAHGERVPGSLVAANSLYALVYGLILVSAAILIFEEREFQ